MSESSSMRAVTYCRFSTDRQDSRSIEDQDRRCRDFATRQDLFVTKIYSDAAKSGASMERAQLQQMLRDAAKKKFDVVLVDDLSRLSRDLGDTWRIVFQDLAAADVRVVDVETGRGSDEDSSRLLFGVKGLFADQYLQAVRRQTHRGLEGRALAGFHTGGRTFGYGTVEEPSPPDPEHPRRTAVVDEAEAAIVRQIFASFAAGKSPRLIADELNRAATPAPHDGGRGNKGLRGWGHTTIRSMLSNERYTGLVTWNTHKWLRVPGKGTRRRVPRPVAEHVAKTVEALRVIDAATWEQVQARFNANKRAKTVGRPKGSVGAGHLLSGLLKCGQCGGSFGLLYRREKAGETYQTLGCVTHKSRGPAICANDKTISERKVRAAVVGHLRNVLTRPDRIEAFIDEFQRRYRELLETSGSRLKSIDGQIARQRQQIEAVMAALVTVPGSKALGARLATEEGRLTQMEAERATLTDQRPKVMPHPALIARYVEDLLVTLDTDVPKARAILLRVLRPFTLTPDGATYKISGALSLSAVLGSGVSEKSSSGGVI
jgi:site-specific DNA recombinase